MGRLSLALIMKKGNAEICFADNGCLHHASEMLKLTSRAQELLSPVLLPD